MDKVLAICENYAIVEKGNPTTVHAEKELKALVDLKLGSDKEYLEKQVKPYLQMYGRRLAIDVRFHQLAMYNRGLPDSLLEKYGYYEYENKRSGHFFLNRTDRSDNNTFVVPLRGKTKDGEGVDSGAYDLSSLQDAMIYVAKLAILSKDGECYDLPVTVEARDHSSVVSFGDMPFQFAYFPEWLPIENVSAHTRDAIVENFGSIRRDRAKNNIAVTLTHHNNETAVSRRANLPKTAASILLVFMMRTYHFGSGSYVVDFKTGDIVKQEPSNLLQSVVESVASGKVHVCPHCKRPIFGNRKFCRIGGCYQRMSEKIHAQFEIGLPLDEALSRYGDYFGAPTIEKWANREGR